ncbi:MAG: hypothetical protein K6T16_00365 [Candidatus Pacearchaeota archaeon]|nr:hypothetical protein [Candidatus Pacearchaeota archaeon]
MTEEKKPRKKEKGKKEEIKKEGKGKTIKRVNMKRVVWTLVIIIVLLVLVLIFVVFRDEIGLEYDKLAGNIFEWQGMKWYKKAYGNITTYSAQLAIYRPAEDKTFYYTLVLRNDPRKLAKIPANITSKMQRFVYISFEAEPLKCTDSIVLATWRLADFIDAIGSQKKGAAAYNLTNLNISETYNDASHEIRNCSHAREGTSVVLLKEGKESRITQEGHCYVLEIADCKTIEVSERFVLALIEIMKMTPASAASEE